VTAAVAVAPLGTGQNGDGLYQSDRDGLYCLEMSYHYYELLLLLY